MRRAWLLAATLLLMPGIAAAQKEPVAKAEAAVPKAPPLPLATNRPSFFIPVTVDRTSREHVPVEVHLLVSADQGKTWSTYARASTDSKGFQFQARDDAEYWFASRTVDVQGRAKPAGDAEPELRIVIDRSQPKIEMDAAVGSGGEIKAAWRISDANVSPELVRLEYQSGDARQSDWKEVKLDPAEQKLAGGMLLGAANWQPDTTTRAVDLRMTVKDRAGNLATESRRVFLPRESRVATPRIPEWRVPPTQANTATPPKSSGDPFTSRQFGGAAPSPIPAPTASPIPSRTPSSAPTPPPSPHDKLASPPASIPSEPLARVPSAVAPPVSDRVVAQPSSTGGAGPLIWPSDAARESAPPAATSQSSQPDRRPPLDPLPPSAAPLPGQDPPLDNAAPEDDELPVGPEKPQLTSSKSFSLDYDIDSVGPSGVRAVELWVTVDGGRNWEKWGEDADRQSPFEIQVESERTFGFRMVIVANNGLATRSPEPGDAADIWIAIDATRPRAKLLQAGYGQGEHAGQLDIRWEADDEHLASRPITISFGETPDGPFTTLAAGLPNNGQYFWTIDPRTPRSLYLRLEARDDAGNMAIDQTPEPISLEGLSPKGRIRAIVPAPAQQPPISGAFRTPLFR